MSITPSVGVGHLGTIPPLSLVILTRTVVSTIPVTSTRGSRRSGDRSILGSRRSGDRSNIDGGSAAVRVGE